MIKILSSTSFYSIKELPFVSLNERKRNAITIARNVHSADNSSIEPVILQGTKVWNAYIYLYMSLAHLAVFRLYASNVQWCRSQRQRGLRRGSVAVLLLVLWVRIPPGHGCLSLVSVVCCQVEVSASGWSLVQRSPTECDVSECDHESTIMRPWPTGADAPW